MLARAAGALALAAFALGATAPAAQAGQIVDRIVAGDTETVIGFGDPPPSGNATAGTGEGLLSRPQGIAFNDPGVADNTTDPQGDSTDGYLYVVERDNHRVQVFDAAGDFKFMFGRGVLTGGDAAEVCDHTQAPCGDPDPTAGDAAGEFSNPFGIAINQATGELYIRDDGNRRVQQFEADGTFIRAWGWGVDDGTAEFQICEAPGDLPCEAGISGGNGGQFSSSTSGPAIAIDPSPPHHVFVGESSRRIQEFEPDGTFVRLWGWNVVPEGEDNDIDDDSFEICESTATGACQTDTQGSSPGGVGGFGALHPRHLVVDTTGTLYASNNNFASNRIERFDTGAATAAELVLQPMTPDNNPDPPQGLLSGTAGPMTIDPDTGNLLATRSSTIQELDITVEPPVEVDRHVVNAAGANDIAVDPATGEIYFSSNSGNIGHRLLATDADGAPPAQMTIDDPSPTVFEDTATFSGTVTPDGPPGFNTSYEFQYSRDGVEWLTWPASRVSLGDTSSTIVVSHEVTGLEPNSDYTVRLATQKSFGNPEYTSAEEIFTSAAIPPSVQTVRPAARTATSAVLAARLNPNNSPTTYRFEWGPEPGPPYPNSVPVPDGDAGDGFGNQGVIEQISGLEPETTYHYRLVADNGVPIDPECDPGTETCATEVEGDEVSFTTRAALPSLPGRAFELVSPADKVNNGVGWWYFGPGNAQDSGFPAHTADRFAVKARHGNVLTDDGAFTYGSDYSLAERVSDEVGWVNRSPFTHAGTFTQLYLTVHIRVATPDLSLATWISSAGMMKVFPEMADWDDGEIGANWSLLSDWQGRWELFGPTDPAQVREWRLGGATAPHLSVDGAYAAWTSLLGGLAGEGDPAHPNWPDLVEGRTVYVDDLSAGLADSFDGNGVHSLAQACTEGTEVPAVNGAGVLGAEACPAPLAGRDDRLISPYGATTTASGGEAGLENVISADGSRLFFLAPDPTADGVPAVGCSGTGTSSLCPPQLYVRQQNPDGEIVTRWISKAEEGLFEEQEASLTGSVRFETATPDGSKVFFRTNAPLTADDPNGEGAPTPGGVTEGMPSVNSWDLYMYELADGDDPTDGGKLTRISAGPDAEADCNSPRGGAGAVAAHRFISDDGSQIYFSCAGQIAGAGPGPAGGITEPAGTPTTADSVNLYHFDQDRPEGERYRFVALLPSEGVGECATTKTRKDAALAAPSGRAQLTLNSSASAGCVRGTADGRFLTFWTQGRLTADDPDATSADIYAYDADADELTRITAPQGGPGGTYMCITDGGPAGTQCYGDPGFGPRGGGLPNLGLVTEPHQSGDRIAFFQSRSRLVPEDEDDAYDVYQWRNGELSLVTTGQSETDGAFLMGNDVSGQNVYLATRDRLSWQDSDSLLDIYTARIGGGIEEPPPPPACGILSGACRGGGTDSSLSTDSGTSAFEGPGNPTDPGPGAAPRRRCTALAQSAAKNRHLARRLIVRARGDLRKARQSANPRRSKALQRRARAGMQAGKKRAALSKRRAVLSKRCRAAARQANANRGSAR